MSEEPPAEEGKLVIVEERIVQASGEVIVRRYQKGRFLGKGGFARCYEFVSLETRKLYACKVVLKESLRKSRAKQKLMSEIKIHNSIQHPGIVGFEHFFEDSENVYILLEMCSNQTFSDMIRRRKRLTELEVQCYLIQIVAALKYLRERRVIHRDLKLGNMFLTDKMEAKIGDFGLATRIEYEGERKRTICGTPNYIAPEVLDSRAGHSFEVDVWSLGVIVYTMLFGKPPFETSDVKTTYKRIRMCAYSFPESVVASPEAKGLISRILVADPSKRPSYEEILANDFLNQGNSIPKLMPAATISIPPTSNFLHQYELNAARTAFTDREVPGTRVVATLDRLQTSFGDKGSHGELSDLDKRHLVILEDEGQPDTWVTKWVDYSSKYGLGYVLNNSTTGVFFNDSTKMLLAPDGHQLFYSEKKEGQKLETVSIYTLTDYPKPLQKKITLLQHFRSYLEDDARQETQVDEADESFHDPVFIKKWTKTDHAVLFRFSNKVIQTIFQDHTELLISSDTRILTYVNKRSERSNHTVASAMQGSNQEIAKRLKYMRDLLAAMLGKSNPGTYREGQT